MSGDRSSTPLKNYTIMYKHTKNSRTTDPTQWVFILGASRENQRPSWKTKNGAKLPKRFYWPQMSAEVNKTVRNFGECLRNTLKLRKRTNRLKLFIEKELLLSVGVYVLASLAKVKYGRRFLLVITDRFTKMTQGVPLRLIFT